jgi:hypothetical protein
LRAVHDDGGAAALAGDPDLAAANLLIGNAVLGRATGAGDVHDGAAEELANIVLAV